MAAPKPIVLVSPGGTPDTCLTVFGQEFHAESAVLRLQSGFFRTFLTAEAKTSSSNFQYEYISKVDKDGTWGLQPKSTVNDAQAPQILMLNTTKEDEVRGFDNLLRALCARRLPDGSLYNYTDLVTLVRLADYYMALPIVSMIVDASMSSDYFENISNDCVETLRLAFHLRSPKLFTDAFILTVGQTYREPDIVLAVDTRLQKLVYKYLAGLTANVSSASHELHSLIGESLNTPFFCANQLILPAIQSAVKQGGFVTRAKEPRFYRYLLNASYKPTDGEIVSYRRGSGNYSADLGAEVTGRIDRLITPLLTNNLQYQAGKLVGKDLDYFLCTRLDDGELPWDPIETEW
ncbi:MAG: hypothetical protein M1835_004024 [Candelina submexicana]|nr:MAG: hypothetical protein M1835_004024 [Candelina submexicana]